jgi:hypothetical protein
MGYIVAGTVEGVGVGEGGLEPNPLRSAIEGARGRLSTGRIVANDGDEGWEELDGAGVGDALNPLDLATLETFAFTRTGGFVKRLSGERRVVGDAGGVG